MEQTNYLIGRQPILNRLEEIVAFELLFRSSVSLSSATVTTSVHATSRVIINTISCFGIKDILGKNRGYINVDADILMSDSLELLPPEAIGLELLESVEITPEIIDRCKYLKLRGFLLALDDHEYRSEYAELYDGIIDVVKIDFIKTPLEQVYDMIDQFHRYPVKLLAEKVDTRHSYLRSRKLGFELFQGYFFSRPSLIQKRRMEDSANTFFKLMQQLSNDADVIEIEATFKQSPALTYKLLLLVNSVSVGRREKIRTVRHAITLIGLLQLKRWVQLAIFADDGNQSMNNPLLDMVAVRAAFMEELSRLYPQFINRNYSPEEAFMVGTLSLLQDVYEISMDEIVSELNLSEDVRLALTDRDGILGELLQIAEMIERIELDEAVECLSKRGIPLISVLECQKKAYKWREELD
ncbi:MAG: diguanylate phosphodiesterase [Geobacteraceae bacterium GWC2_55_20]|nr:MAG: diguanylate phosphodiesterase [Geobacteraceae bacterium GWC2_55_20]HBA72914.1 EAL domain-containing protein [Geobacter sp.]HCE69297.1 EAL domain-containing protein [Geobacter sp.]